MKICIIGGIYGKGGVAKSYVKATPETTLEAGLRDAGHSVTTQSHYDDVRFGDFDVVHVHHLSYGAARLACDPSGCPFVFTPHDASHMNGVHPGFMRHRAMRYVMSRADAIVSLSQAEADFQRASYPTQGAAIEVIPNGVSTTIFQPVQRNPKGNPWRVLFVGQLIALKGCDLLLRALAQLEHPFQLALAYQTDELKAELESLAQTLGIADRVSFLGKQEPRQLARLYQNSDLLVLPSSTEALPSVITEAMLCGLPFVASAVGGIPEQAAGFGRLVANRTPEAFAAAISSTIQQYPDSRTCEAMSSHARKTYSIESMIAKHLALYERVAAPGKVRRNARNLIDTTIRAAVRYRGRGSTIASQNPAAISTNT
jgi:glycosyltransferase involved in cell wall biosynthesis